ncbi:hypothetical protein EJF36_17545 [Bacillus sp. HMF5848]|uniref:DHHW family protein n=1 Tax=Bacillus sp. HMF5848 TaxID=2495421 RepID=UPI000F7B2049|nr:DHHW family protein [Bacillus sp. HMF5848]RSK28526.1 hypothetical protein EJF36_17545 [Bacillus sp. HMF5848]
MKTLHNTLIAIGFFTTLIAISFLTIAMPDKKVSDIENRFLEQFPTFSEETIINGEFTKKFESYYSDQIFLRNIFIEAYTRLQLLLNKTVISNTVVLDNDWILSEPFAKVYTDYMDKSTGNLNTLANQFPKTEFYFAAAPHKTNMLMDKFPNYLPENVGVEAQQYFWSNLHKNVIPIDLHNYFLNHYSYDERENMYFRTDHHWNMDGAFAGYTGIMEALATQSNSIVNAPSTIDQYTKTCLTNNYFVGSYNRQLYLLIDASKEVLCHYEPNSSFNFSSVYAKDGRGKEFTNFEDIYKTDTEGQVTYAGLYAGDFSVIKYNKEKADNDKKVVIVKDSYANAITPFIAQHFTKTTVLDLRHYTEKTLKDFLEEEQADIVLFIYNNSNLFGNMFQFE